MFKPTFNIMCRTAEGETFKVFTWCHDEASGIARAKNEAPRFGYHNCEFWAERV